MSRSKVYFGMDYAKGKDHTVLVLHQPGKPLEVYEAIERLQQELYRSMMIPLEILHPLPKVNNEW